ncbi:MAG: hypothetical protein ACR2RV_13905, partial [Verrucomicrobiales bacterium]
DGRFFHQFFYPFRGDFFLSNTNPGTPIAWLPDDGSSFAGGGEPVKVVYNTFWRSDYPKLKRGETLTYQGGEYFNENPGSNGLPALVAMASAEVVYDSATPDMVLTAANLDAYSARVTRPLDRAEVPMTIGEMEAAGFTPAETDKLLIIAERWYFKELPGSLQKRLYYDSLQEKLVFRGYLNDKDSGDPDLTAGPDPLNILEPNVLTGEDYTRLIGLASTGNWDSKIGELYLKTQNPAEIDAGGENLVSRVFRAGVKDVPDPLPGEFFEFWLEDLSGPAPGSPSPDYVPLDSFGAGAALVANPAVLTQAFSASSYVTVAENNRSELNGAPVSLHIVEIIPDRYRGAIKVIEGADAFSEKISLQHNGEFGGNTGDLYYEWWVRDAGSLDVVADEILADGTLATMGASGETLWQMYSAGLGAHSIVFEGRPDLILADKLILVRYRHESELNGWKLVPFEIADPLVAWQPGNPAPFQWAGAANSPQLQADGSKRYVPQLLMGWVKRVLDRINPYEARYTDFFGNESPAVYSSQIQIAGGPYAGKVALNPDKNVIENTGLIELYETVLQRARELSIDNSSNGDAGEAVEQALLLAATRLSVLYELLAQEAYGDAQDSTITVTDESGAAAFAGGGIAYTHAFQNQEADLLQEELALLRGSDFRKSYPVFNRMIWNYVKGLGEAAYNVNYNISDENTDGFINEDDARALYPQGHGDSWGHFLSATDQHYALLRANTFDWNARAELYSLMSNVIETDYLDEKTFARLAAGKARAGRDIVRATYRLNYTQDSDGQWQGYTDSADPARAWGVSEWGHRASQGAYFDWAVANALMPDVDAENLDRIDRQGAVAEIEEIAGGLYEIQSALDEANGGVNPLGFDADTIAFDIDPTFLEVGSTIQGETHFEQIYDRALLAGKNALTTLEYAASAQNQLRRIADDTGDLVVEAFRQDLDYRNR